MKDFALIDDDDFNEMMMVDINSGDKNQKTKQLMEKINKYIPFDLSKQAFMK